MAGQGKLFIDIDREPERNGARPVGMGARLGSMSPLWPAQAPAPALRDLAAKGSAPLGEVPLLAGAERTGSNGEGAARPISGGLSSDLAASLAAFTPNEAAPLPVSLAAALAAIPTQPIFPMPPAPASPITPDQPVQPLFQPPPPAPETVEPIDGWRAPGGIYRVSAASLEPATSASLSAVAPAAPTDDYLTRSYDFTRPEVAKLYDRTVVPLWSTPFGRMLLTTFLACPRQPGWQVVDVACGVGYPTLELAQLLGADGDVAGIDVWKAGIERARAKAGALRLQNATFLVADIGACDLPERSFDAAICNLGLTNFAHPDAALAGIARLLQPNGTLILTTNLQGTMQEFFETYQSVLNALGLVDLGWDLERVMHMQPTIERVEALLDLAGFTVDQTINDHFALEFPDGSAFLRSPLVGMGFLSGWRGLISDTALRRVVFREIERRLNARAAAWGRLDLTAPMLCLTARRRAMD